MKITRKDPVTGKVTTLDINITSAQHNAWKAGYALQDVAPQLSAEERNFMLWATTPTVWDNIFSGPSW